MNVTESAELYHDQMIGMLERVCGDGWDGIGPDLTKTQSRP